jgi:pyruvate kinase
MDMKILPMRRTTIVATLGPASFDPDTIEALVQAGMSVARINFSHGTYAEHRESIANIRAVSKQTGLPIACLQDLCGPKIRTGPMSEPDGVLLETGNRFILSSDEVEGTADKVSTTYDRLHLDIQPGEHVLLDDGAIELEVLEVLGRDLVI